MYKPMVYLTMDTSQEVMETIQNLNGFHNPWHVNANCAEFHFLTRCITCVFNRSIKNVQTHGLPDDGYISGSNGNHSKFEWFPHSFMCEGQSHRVSLTTSMLFQTKCIFVNYLSSELKLLSIVSESQFKRKSYAIVKRATTLSLCCNLGNENYYFI